MEETLLGALQRCFANTGASDPRYALEQALAQDVELRVEAPLSCIADLDMACDWLTRPDYGAAASLARSHGGLGRRFLLVHNRGYHIQAVGFALADAEDSREVVWKWSPGQPLLVLESRGGMAAPFVRIWR